jgi:taurine dioxygenase
MELKPLIGALGAEVFDIDLSVPLGDNMVSAVRQALWQHQVLVFRDQKLTIDQHKAFARNFGPLNVQSFIYAKALPDHPEVVRVVKEKEDRRVFGEAWHSDVSFLEKPVLGSALYALETPKTGGDTLFANMYLAYENLSDAMKAMLEPLVAIHETDVPETDPVTKLERVPRRLEKKGFAHPVINVHPETGKKLLNVNRTYTAYIKGMTVEESRPLLTYLCDHAVKAEHTCRVRWAPGTLTMWDNRSTQHMPINDYHGQRREMHRVTIET